MKVKVLIILFILFSLLYIKANEKEACDKNKISFNFNKGVSDNYKKTTDKNNSEYIKKANGFLAMGITGIIFTSLSIPASIAFPVLLVYFFPSIIYYLFVLIIAPLVPFLGAGIPMLIFGFIYFKRNRYKKTTNPFSSNKTSLIKFNITLKGAINA